jgi:hypothetical protein
MNEQSGNMHMISKKKIFMDKIFGHFKSLVLRKMQSKLFLNTVDEYKKNIYFLEKQPEVDLFEYYYKTRDIWSRDRNFIYYMRSRLDGLVKTDNSFVKYHMTFGFSCPYLKVDGTTCSKLLNINTYLYCNKNCKKYNTICEHKITEPIGWSLCEQHKEDEETRKQIVINNLSEFPKELCNIIIGYSEPYNIY